MDNLKIRHILDMLHSLIGEHEQCAKEEKTISWHYYQMGIGRGLTIAVRIITDYLTTEEKINGRKADYSET